MDQERMKELIERHIQAEAAGDSSGAVSMYTEDVEHDVVGWPTGPVQGPAAAKDFYDQLIAMLRVERMEPTRELFADDFCVVEHDCTAVINGDFMGIPGNGRRVSFRMIHVWEFKDDAMSRENVWMDGGSIAAQLGAAA